MKTSIIVGSLNMDLILVTERVPKIGETLRVSDMRKVSGGKGMNQAVAVSRLGGSAKMIGCLGQDEHGEKLKSELVSEGIDVMGIQRTITADTGLAVITVTSNGDNSILVYPGSNFELESEGVLRAIDSVKEPECVVMQMEIPESVVLATLDFCQQKMIPVILNPSPFRPLSDRALSQVQTIVLNEIEAEQLCGEYETPENVILKLLDKGIEQVIVTLGSEGVYFNEGRLVSHVPAVRVTPVDTTAAGDTFLGAYVAQMSKGHSVRSAIEFAVKAAAIAVTRMGAQPSIPKLSEIL